MRKIPTTYIQDELINSDILGLTNEENIYFGFSGESHQLSSLELTNEENVYSGYSGGAHQFRYLGAHK
jgi:hypothetical protein